MDREEIIRKANSDEGLTVEEILEYRKIAKPQSNIYGKYGTIAKQYLEEHNQGKMWSLAGDLPKYLHGIDEQAEKQYENMYASLSNNEKYKKTGEYVTDLKKETEIQRLIEEAILNQIVYEND